MTARWTGARRRAGRERVMDTDTIEQEKATIYGMGQEEMARLWRFAPAGHPYFDKTLPLWEHFEKRFKSLGGMTPAISKSLG